MGLLSILFSCRRAKTSPKIKKNPFGSSTVFLEQDLSHHEEASSHKGDVRAATTGNAEKHAIILAAGKQFFEGNANQNAGAIVGASVPDCEVAFRDQEFGLECFLDELHKVWEAFPDFNLRCPNELQLERDTKGEVHCAIHGFVPNGHHTGAAYGFGPYEPVPITNKYIENAPETIRIYVNEGGKVYKVLIDAEGDMTGPAGIYQQIGGFPLL